MYNILIADDDNAIAEMLKEYLLQKRPSNTYNVEITNSGDSTVARISTGGLDFLILDGRMPPGPKGSDIAIMVRQSGNNVPIALFTGNPNDYTDLKEKVSLCEVFAKPAEYEKLLEYVDRILLTKQINPKN
jgi:DNA-binding NtrC family response regulator